MYNQSPQMLVELQPPNHGSQKILFLVSGVYWAVEEEGLISIWCRTLWPSFYTLEYVHTLDVVAGISPVSVFLLLLSYYVLGLALLKLECLISLVQSTLSVCQTVLAR
jgi:hypothetical protein